MGDTQIAVGTPGLGGLGGNNNFRHNSGADGEAAMILQIDLSDSIFQNDFE